MLKCTAPSIAHPLTCIINSSLLTGELPFDWKNSFVVPIPKTTSPSTSSCDYCPISLFPLVRSLNAMCTTTYMIFALYIMSFRYLNMASIPTSPQKPLFSLFYTLGFPHWTPISPSVFLDLAKAFDSVPHKLLYSTTIVYCLLSSVSTSLLTSFTGFQTDSSIGHMQQTVVSGSNSLRSHAMSGVPQGSVLRPLLFILYINNLTTLPISSMSKIILYADDILLSYPITSFSSFHTVQSDIDLISSCLFALNLAINPNKTKYCFSLDPLVPKHPPPSLVLSK